MRSGLWWNRDGDVGAGSCGIWERSRPISRFNRYNSAEWTETTMTEQKADAITHVKDQAAVFAQAIIEQAANRAIANAGKAKTVAAKARRRVPSVHKVGEEVVPSVREVALQAASAALDLWQEARERAAQSMETAEQTIVEHATVVANQAERGAKLAASAIGERAGEISDQAKETTKSVSDSTVHAGKETGAALIWSAAAAGIVFYVLLDKKRREQLLRVAEAIANQARELIQDYQGYDEEFI